MKAYDRTAIVAWLLSIEQAANLYGDRVDPKRRRADWLARKIDSIGHIAREARYVLNVEDVRALSRSRRRRPA